MPPNCRWVELCMHPALTPAPWPAVGAQRRHAARRRSVGPRGPRRVRRRAGHSRQGAGVSRHATLHDIVHVHTRNTAHGVRATLPWSAQTAALWTAVPALVLQVYMPAVAGGRWGQWDAVVRLWDWHLLIHRADRGTNAQSGSFHRSANALHGMLDFLGGVWEEGMSNRGGL